VAFPLGPLADSDTATLVRTDVAALARNLRLDGGDFTVLIPEGEIRGLLLPWNTRARQVLVSLLRGYSLRSAAATAGIDHDTVTRWGKKHTDFSQALTKAREWGFTRTFESELQRRALAGPDDRGSMQALLAVAKARAPEYREKSQLQLEVLHRAEAAEAAAFSFESISEPTG
jgi:hypothetical protein